MGGGLSSSFVFWQRAFPRFWAPLVMDLWSLFLSALEEVCVFLRRVEDLCFHSFCRGLLCMWRWRSQESPDFSSVAQNCEKQMAHCSSHLFGTLQMKKARTLTTPALSMNLQSASKVVDLTIHRWRLVSFPEKKLVHIGMAQKCKPPHATVVPPNTVLLENWGSQKAIKAVHLKSSSHLNISPQA